MKSQNFMVKFKNSFALTEKQPQTIEVPIMKDKLSTVTNTQLSSLIELYTRDTFENGFNPYLAFRVINLYCYSAGEDNKIANFELKNEVNRFLNHHLNDNQLENIQQYEVRRKLPFKHYRLFKIRTLSCLNKFYLHNRQPLDRKKSTLTLRQLCKQTLKAQKIKHDQQIYCEILDILLQLQMRECQLKLKKKKKFEGLELVNNMVKYLESTEFTLKSQKYQQQLMHSYWYCAELHYQLHYIAYTKKYCQIVINIAQRLQNQHHIKEIAEQLLEKVTI